MQDWNPALYLRFADERTRPAAELLARVPLAQARHVVDLGCGPGNSTELLAQRFPGAQVLGIDHSPAMLQAARERLPGITFSQADIATWSPPAGQPACDLIYANASLQWVGRHEQLIARLFAALAPAGVLAIQMPDNLHEPSHRLMREVAGLPQFAPHLGDAAGVRAPILAPQAYYDLLAAPGLQVATIDVWHTVYQHVMESPAAITLWLSATGLKPFVEALPEALRAQFIAEYERRVDAAYGPRADGRRLLAFPRLFIVAQRQP